MSIATVRTALAAALRTCEASGFGLRATPYITEEVTPPQAMFDFSVEPHTTFGPSGASTLVFTVSVFAGRAAERASQIFLDELRDPANEKGIQQVIEGSSSLHEQVQYAAVRSVSAVDIKTIGTVEYLSVDFEIEVVV